MTEKNNLSLEKFNPKEVELQTLASQYENFSIKDVHDKEWIQKWKEWSKILQKTRTTIEKQGKEMREEANNFRNAVLVKEKTLLAIVVPVENKINEELARIAKLQEIENRKAQLFERRRELVILSLTMSDEEIITYNDEEFIQILENERKRQDEVKRQKKEADDRKRKDEMLIVLWKIDYEKLEVSEEEFLLFIIAEKKRIQEEKEAEIERVRKEAEEKAERQARERVLQGRIDKLKKFNYVHTSISELAEMSETNFDILCYSIESIYRDNEIKRLEEEEIKPIQEEIKEVIEENKESESIEVIEQKNEEVEGEIEIKESLNPREEILKKNNISEDQVGSWKEYFITSSQDQKEAFLYKLVDSL